MVKSEPTPAAVEDDGSSTESEYFDEGEEDAEQQQEQEEEGEVRETKDALGGVSIQSSNNTSASNHLSAPPAAAVAHIKHETSTRTHHGSSVTTSTYAAAPCEALGHASAVVTSAQPSMLATNAIVQLVKPEPQGIKSETRAPTTHALPKPHQNSTTQQPTAASPTVSPSRSVAMAPHAPSPPVASGHATAPLHAHSTAPSHSHAQHHAPHPQHWQHPALAHAPHMTGGYQPPPPINYAPPRPLTQHASVVAPAVPPASAGSQASPQRRATAVQPQTNATQWLKCTTCDASLTKHHTLVPGSRDCKCCGKAYPTWRFPTQNQQDRSSQRRCDSCYSAFISRRGDVAPPPSAVPVPQPQRATPIRVPLAPVRAPPPAPVRTTAVRGAVATPVALPRTSGKCAKCKHVTYACVRPSLVSANKNLRCRCCELLLLKDACFSKAQRVEGKHRCKACLGHVQLSPNGVEHASAAASATAVAPAPKNVTKKAKPKTRAAATAAAAKVVSSLPSKIVSAAELEDAERQVAKYHLARRSLQRRREANDLRGSTRLEYEKQLAQEDVALQALEKKLRSQYPDLFSKSAGIKVVAPPVRRDERDPKSRLAKNKANKAIAKEAQLAVKTARAARRAASAARLSASDVIDMTDGRASPAIVSAPAATIVARRRAAAGTAAGATKRKAPSSSTATASASSASAKETPAKKRRAAAADDDNDDPWLAAQAEIAQGLSSLLGDGLDHVLAPSAAASRPAGRTDATPPVDNSTYAPKTKLEAASPPRSTVVTRARKRTLAQVEVIDITDDSPPASPRAAKRVK